MATPNNPRNHQEEIDNAIAHHDANCACGQKFSWNNQAQVESEKPRITKTGAYVPPQAIPPLSILYFDHDREAAMVCITFNRELQEGEGEALQEYLEAGGYGRSRS